MSGLYANANVIVCTAALYRGGDLFVVFYLRFGPINYHSESYKPSSVFSMPAQLTWVYMRLLYRPFYWVIKEWSRLEASVCAVCVEGIQVCVSVVRSSIEILSGVYLPVIYFLLVSAITSSIRLNGLFVFYFISVTSEWTRTVFTCVHIHTCNKGRHNAYAHSKQRFQIVLNIW